MKSKVLKLIVFVGLFCVTGMLLGNFAQTFRPMINASWNAEKVLYSTPDRSLKKAFSNQKISSLGWEALLPAAEKSLLAHYQTLATQDFSEQLALSLQASSDDAYKSALYSTNVVNDALEKFVSISGFIVPIEVNADRSIKSFFLVPYFGACIHYPPPPPNQMIFVQLVDGFKNIELHKAFTLSGILSKGLFEDPLGTSAYLLEVVNIKPYQGQPDDFRQH